MKIAIVDDEQYWRDKTLIQINQILPEDAFTVDSYNNGRSYLDSNIEYDISFIDIDMPGLDGFQTICEASEHNGEGLYIILTTHTEMSRRGYMVDAFRYIDKANIESEIREALQSASFLINRNVKITVSVVGHGNLKVMLNDIIYMETEKHNIIIHTTNGILKCNNKISDIEKILQDDWFFRCHNAYIVNLDKIKRVDKKIILLNNGHSIEIAQRRLSEFNKKYLRRQYMCGNA